MAHHPKGSIQPCVQRQFQKGLKAQTTVHLHVYVTEKEAAAITRARNGEPLSTWCRAQLVAASAKVEK